MMRARFIIPSILCLLFAALSASAEAPSAADLVPGNGVAAIHFTDWRRFKAEVAESELGKLWAEPEMQAFAKPAWDEFFTGYENLRKVHRTLPALSDIEAVLGGDVALTVAVVAKRGPPQVALAARVGDGKALKRLLDPVFGGLEMKEGEVFSPFPGGPELILEKGFLLATFGSPLQAMRDRLADPAKRADSLASSTGWGAAKKLFGTGTNEIPLLRVQLIAPPLVEIAVAESGEKRAAEYVKKFGIDGIESIALQVGARDKRPFADLGVALRGAPTGIVAAMMDARPITAAALKLVPANARFCSVVRFDAANLIKTVRAMLDEKETKALDESLGRASKDLGIDLEKDLLASLGDTWLTYDVGGTELFGWVPSIAFAVNTPDPVKAQKTLDALAVSAKKIGDALAADPGGIDALFRETTIGQTRVHYATITSIPISPSAAVVKNQVIFTISVSGMRRALAQWIAPGDLAGAPGFQQAIERATGKPFDANTIPGQFSYASAGSGTSTASIANAGQIIHGFASIGMKRNTRFAVAPEEAWLMSVVDKLDFALFPAEDVFARHAEPSATVLLVREGGWVWRGDLTLPSPGLLGSGQGGVSGIIVFAATAVPNLLRSRMAANETAAAASCKAYAEAQDIYRRTDWDKDGVLEYAQSLHGGVPVADVDNVAEKDIPEPTAAQKEALAPLIKKLSSEDFAEREAATAAMEKLGPGIIRPLVEAAKSAKDVEVRTRCENVITALKRGLVGAAVRDTMFGLMKDNEQEIYLIDKAFAEAEGNPNDPGTPKSGYRYKILLAQGPAANGGAKSYLSDLQPGARTANLSTGYALIAYPAQYDKTGRNCFIINNAGVIYQADLGPDTHKIVETMTEYNPDLNKGWVPTE